MIQKSSLEMMKESLLFRASFVAGILFLLTAIGFNIAYNTSKCFPDPIPMTCEGLEPSSPHSCDHKGVSFCCQQPMATEENGQGCPVGVCAIKPANIPVASTSPEPCQWMKYTVYLSFYLALSCGAAVFLLFRSFNQRIRENSYLLSLSKMGQQSVLTIDESLTEQGGKDKQEGKEESEKEEIREENIRKVSVDDNYQRLE